MIMSQVNAALYEYLFKRKGVIRVTDGSGIKIIIKTYDDRNFKLLVRKSETVIHILDKIRNSMRFNEDEHELLYQGKTLDTIKTIEYYNIGADKVLNVVFLQKVLIFVETMMDGRIISFKVKTNETILDIKKFIEKKTLLKIKEQLLKYDGLVLEDEDMTLEDYNIKENSKIVVERIMLRLWVKLWDKRIDNIEVGVDTSVFDFCKEVEGKFGLSSGKYDLEYEGRILDDYKTVANYNIWHNDFIMVIPGVVISLNFIIMDRCKFYMDCAMSDTILNIKKKIQIKIGVAPKQQQLVKFGQILNNDKTVEYYHISDHNYINVLTPSGGAIEVYAKTMHGRTEILDCALTDTILYIKMKIEVKMGLEADEQKLEYDGRILEDDKTVEFYQIYGWSVINVDKLLRGGMGIFAKTMDGKTVALEVLKTDTINYIKKVIKAKTRVPQEDLRLVYQGRILEDDKTVKDYNIVEESYIEVLTTSGGEILVYAEIMDENSYGFDCENADSIFTIKERIHGLAGLSVADQQLEYQGVLLDDHKTVGEYNITDHSCIYVISKLKGGMQIFARTMNVNRIAFICSNTDTILEIKNKIHQKTGVLPELQRLDYKGLILEDNNKTIGEYGVGDMDVINVSLRRRLRIKCIQEYEVLFDMSGTVLDLKKEIQSILGLVPERQTLKYEDIILCDDKTMSNHHIADAKVINIEAVFEPIQILIKIRQQSNKITFSVNDSYIIMDIKTKIKEEIRLEPNKQLLKMNGNILSDDRKTIYQYGITNISVIYVYELLKIMILSYNMESVPLEIYSCDRMIDVKKKIEEKIRIPWEDQILEYNDAIMKDDLTVDDYNIGTESGLLMSPRSLDLGLCLVISNETFGDGYACRPGTKIDEENIATTFRLMGYDVKIHQNVTSSEMSRIIEDTKREVQGSHIMLIVFVLSHGTNDGVVFSDEAILPFKNIWTPFSNENFPKISGKPKLFFFGCCLGDKKNMAVSAASTSQVHHDAPPSSADLCPAIADIFTGYATCESFVSCRVPSTGTLYIDCLCKVVRDHPLWSVADIHQEVQAILSSRIIEGYFQMPQFNSKLRRHAYFYDKGGIDIEVHAS